MRHGGTLFFSVSMAHSATGKPAVANRLKLLGIIDTCLRVKIDGTAVKR